jgi:prolyl-tRNA synthetase
MKLSKSFLSTLRDNPRDADVVSQQLLMRANMIRKHGAGLYSYLPFFVKSFLKLENIMREEFDKIGWQEVMMPMVIPAELWQESGRWDTMGKEMARLKDRKDNDFCLGPTHEEVVTDMVRAQVTSYKQLPQTLYQITNKFRDEIRPRFGLMRAREFVMMDGYSFAASASELDRHYEEISGAYEKIFQRSGLKFVRVEADTGAIGGSGSHEFHVLAQSGEDLILAAEDNSYAANVEKAETPPPALQTAVHAKDWGKPSGPFKKTPTPGKKTIQAVCDFLKLPQHRSLKTLVYRFRTRENPKGWQAVVCYIAGDRQLNEVKLNAHLGRLGHTILNLEAMPEADVVKLFECPVGYLGPIQLKGAAKEALQLLDREVLAMHGLCCGANEVDQHFTDVEPDRDLKALFPQAFQDSLDLVTAKEGEVCPRSASRSVYKASRGIEVGHIFKLGDKYSKAMKANFVDEAGKSAPFVMGCYGIGVTRTIAAAIEQNFDSDGILWPKALAPFHITVISLAKKSGDECDQAASALYTELKKLGAEVILDDRDMGPGAKFKDADLLGIPLRIVVSPKGLEAGEIEYSLRKAARDKKMTKKTSALELAQFFMKLAETEI